MKDQPDDPIVKAVQREFDALRGKMLPLFEAIGLPERQEKAFKSNYKNLSYDAQSKVLALLQEPKLTKSLRDANAVLAFLDDLLDELEDETDPVSVLESLYDELVETRDQLAHVLKVASRLGVNDA